MAPHVNQVQTRSKVKNKEIYSLIEDNLDTDNINKRKRLPTNEISLEPTNKKARKETADSTIKNTSHPTEEINI